MGNFAKARGAYALMDERLYLLPARPHPRLVDRVGKPDDEQHSDDG